MEGNLNAWVEKNGKRAHGEPSFWKHYTTIDHPAISWLLLEENLSKVNDYIVTSQISRKFLYGTPWASLKTDGRT